MARWRIVLQAWCQRPLQRMRTKMVDSADQSLRYKVVTVDQVENGSPTKVRKKKKKKSAIPGEITV